MKKRKFLSILLAFMMTVSLFMSMTAQAALTPPPNSLVQQEKKNATRDFATQGVWDSWVDEGSPVVEALGTGGPTGNSALKFTGGGAKGMVLLDQFSDLKDFNELTFAIKSTQPFTIKFALRDQTATPQDIGSSRMVSIPSTQGEWKNVSVKRSEFYGGVLTDEQIDSLRSIYDEASGKYKPVVFMYMGSQEATISDFYARWYELIQPVEKVISAKTLGYWGTWGGTIVENKDGMGEDGVSKGFYITKGKGGGGTQLALIDGNFSNFVGFDAFCLRVKSTSSFQVGIWMEYRLSKSPTVKSRNVSVPSTKGEWKDVYIPVEGLKPLENGDWIHNMQSRWVETGTEKNYEPVVLMRIEQTNFGDSNYAIIDNYKALWYSKYPTMQSISFTNDGENADEGLMPGTTDVNVVLQNTSLAEYKGALLVAALYDIRTNKLVSMNTKSIDVPQMGVSNPTTVSVNIPPSEDEFDYKIKVMLWANNTTLNQITEVMTYDAYGVSGQN